MIDFICFVFFVIAFRFFFLEIKKKTRLDWLNSFTKNIFLLSLCHNFLLTLLSWLMLRFVFLLLCIFVYLFIFLFVHLFICLFIHLFICLYFALFGFHVQLR